MLKKEFVEISKQLGYKSYKDLVEALKYHRRTLDRYKLDDKISENISKAVLKHKKNGVVKSEKTTQKPKPKTTQKKETPINTQVENNTENIKEKTTQEPTQKVQENTVGIDISNEDYHGSSNMSVSKIKCIIDNAKEFYHKYIKRDLIQDDTDALIIGKLHHTLVLEPHKLDEEYVLLDISSTPRKDDLVDAVEALGGKVNMMTNSKEEIVVSDTVPQLKEKLKELVSKSGKTVVSRTQLDKAMQTSKKALESEFELVHGGRTLLKANLKTLLQHDKCYVEKTFYGEIDGVKVQVRPDILINLGAKNDVWFVIDLKTIEAATPDMFVKQGGSFYWDMQETLYTEVLRQNKILVRNFYFNCAGKKEHSGAEFYEWGQSTKDEAKKVMKAGLIKYKYCLENNIWLERKFDYVKKEFEPIAAMEVPAYRQYQFADIGV